MNNRNSRHRNSVWHRTPRSGKQKSHDLRKQRSSRGHQRNRKPLRVKSGHLATLKEIHVFVNGVASIHGLALLEGRKRGELFPYAMENRVIIRVKRGNPNEPNKITGLDVSNVRGCDSARSLVVSALESVGNRISY